MIAGRAEMRIEARARNNRLWHVIFDGYASVSEFCRLHGLSPQAVGDLLNLRSPPVGASGEYRPLAMRIAEIAGFSVEYLFPLRLYHLPATRAVRELELSQLPAGIRELQALPAPDDPIDDLERKELSGAISAALDSLSERERSVLQARFGLEDGVSRTIGQISRSLDLTKERVRQIEEKALRKMRDPQRSDPIFAAQGEVTDASRPAGCRRSVWRLRR